MSSTALRAGPLTEDQTGWSTPPRLSSQGHDTPATSRARPRRCPPRRRAGRSRLRRARVVVPRQAARVAEAPLRARVPALRLVARPRRPPQARGLDRRGPRLPTRVASDAQAAYRALLPRSPVDGPAHRRARRVRPAIAGDPRGPGRLARTRAGRARLVRGRARHESGQRA